MCRLTQMFLCSDFADRKWSLPIDTPPGVRRGMIGWRMSSHPVDDGAPEAVARILAARLVQHARVTFAEGIQGPLSRFFPWPIGRVKWSFVHTTDAGEAERLFDAAYFSWSMGSQLAFLSPASAPPPAISKAHYKTWPDRALFLRLAEIGVSGILAAGVDGDVGGLYTFDGQLWDDLLQAFREGCESAGGVWREVGEEEAATLLAY